jgi:hypothetical protein
MSTIHLFNRFHLGDGIFMMNYLYQIRNHLINNEMTVVYHCEPAYKLQLEEFVAGCEGRIQIAPLAETPADAIDVWMRHSFPHFDRFPFNDFLVKHLNRIARQLHAPKIRTIFYKDTDFAARYERLPDSCREVDILFINAVPKSAQYNYKKPEWDALAHELIDAGYKVVSTSLIRGVPSTIQHSLTVKDIGAVARRAKYIVAVNSGPVAACLNEDAITYVSRWFIFDKDMKYKYPTMQMCLSLDQVRQGLLPKAAPTATGAVAANRP